MTPQEHTGGFVVIDDPPENGIYRLRLTGGLDATAAPSLHALAREQLAASPRLLALDLTHLARLTSAGALALADVAEWAGQADIALCLIAPPAHPVYDALIAVDLGELFEVHPDLTSALADMR
ncbi:STAS domain-containing protein [Pseudonocardia bannensis]|uniref:STAS domain-containing protein n=1 Tax=Pseudonocardia bannensis TaxID=630973 RepID=A0A848DNX8_9PSEU|nr:STAS domain-containing protein [Pseudonocardia bannensis]NMH94121.1 STAS domain-containing protein [Pseudonocardia bannensis]